MQYACVQAVAKRYEVEYVEVSAKSGENVAEMFEALPTKIKAMWEKIESEAAAREDYTTIVVSMTRNESQRECCNIF